MRVCVHGFEPLHFLFVGFLLFDCFLVLWIGRSPMTDLQICFVACCLQVYVPTSWPLGVATPWVVGWVGLVLKIHYYFSVKQEKRPLLWLVCTVVPCVSSHVHIWGPRAIILLCVLREKTYSHIPVCGGGEKKKKDKFVFFLQDVEP